MTEEQIATMRAAGHELFMAMPKRHTAEMKEAADRYAELTAKCDHTYADGSTAMEGRFLMTVCRLCGANDL